MKKSIILIAAAVMALGMTACIDDEINPMIDGTEITPRVKSAADLVGTNWEYTTQDVAVDLGNGDTIVLPLGGLVFGLNFDSNYAHFVFPQEVIAMEMTEVNGACSLQQIQGLDYVYSYNGGTHSGNLIANTTDDNGNIVNVNMPFTYTVATDAINMDLTVTDGTDTTTYNIVYNRATI